MAPTSNDYTHQLMDQARVELPGASDAGLKLTLYLVLHEFFNDSSAWTEDIAFTTIQGQQTYVLTPAEVPPGQIIRLAGVIDANLVGYASQMPTIGSVSLNSAPNAGMALTATVIKNMEAPVAWPPPTPVTFDQEQPGPPAIPDIPSWVIPVWGPRLMHGVVGKMMFQQNKPYSNPQQAVYHLKRFRDGIAEARVSKLRRNTFGTNAWRYPQGFRTRGQRGGTVVGNSNSFS